MTTAAPKEGSMPTAEREEQSPNYLSPEELVAFQANDPMHPPRPAPLPIPVRGHWYITECESCGWTGSSEQCGDGGGPDHDDIFCPVCCHPMAGDAPSDADTAKHGEAVYQRIVKLEADLLAQADTAAQAVAENDRLRASLANSGSPCAYCNLPREDWSKCASGFPGCARADDAMLCPHVGAELETADKLEIAQAEVARLSAEVERLRADKARLDFLDRCNARLNAAYGTTYGWKLVLNHNVNRLMLADLKVDLHDSEGSNAKLPSCRLAIDEALARTALAAGQDKEGGKPSVPSTDAPAAAQEGSE